MIWAYRAWHDSMHLEYNLDFTQNSEVQLSYRLASEAVGLGWSPASCQLVRLDLYLHVRHWYLHHRHPENQRAMLQNYLLHHDFELTLQEVW